MLQTAIFALSLLQSFVQIVHNALTLFLQLGAFIDFALQFIGQSLWRVVTKQTLHLIPSLGEQFFQLRTFAATLIGLTLL